MARKKKKLTKTATTRRASRRPRKAVPTRRRVTKSTKSTKSARKTKSTTKKAKPSKPRSSPKKTRKRRLGKTPTPPPPPQKLVEPEPKEFDEPVQPKEHPEQRFFQSSSALLGYLEGRPGVRNPLNAFPSLGGGLPEKSPWSKQKREDVKARLESTPLMQDKRASSGNAERLFRDLLDCCEWADDGGVSMEFSVESASLAGES